MRIFLMAVVLGVLLSVAPSVGIGSATAQTQNPTPGTGRPQQPPRTQTLPPFDDQPALPDDPLAALREAGRVRAVANERQKKIMDETEKLLQLATELKAEVDKTTKDQMSLETIRKAEEIEKLAHDVKQRMKG
ncbi:MAG: hypothetical protein ABI147_07250 [Acidobacteriaceae bacterium]